MNGRTSRILQLLPNILTSKQELDDENEKSNNNEHKEIHEKEDQEKVIT